MKTIPSRLVAVGIAILPAVLCLAILLISRGCGETVSYRSRETFAMDTVLSFRLPDMVTEEQYQETLAQIKRLEEIFSRTVPDSVTSRFNHSESGMEITDPDFLALLSRSLEIAGQTGGAFDLTAGPLTELWDITGENPEIPDESEIQTALTAVGYRKLTLQDGFLSKENSGVSLDFGGCAKGYICEAVLNQLKQLGVESGILSFGGNVGILGPLEGKSTCRVGIANPDYPEFAAGSLPVDRGFVSVSGDYERYFEADGIRYHHIFDPKTGRPAQSGVRSVAVWSEDGTLADALSTALFVMGVQGAQELYESGIYSFEAVFYLSDGRYYVTDGIRDRDEHVSDSVSREFGTE